MQTRSDNDKVTLSTYEKIAMVAAGVALLTAAGYFAYKKLLSTDKS